MKQQARADAIVAALDAKLTKVLGVRCAADLADFVTHAGGPRYLRRPVLRIAHHFDVEPPFLLFDPLLGSLGIVDVVLPSEDSNAEKIRTNVRRQIDVATYARHLLLRDPGLGGHAALTVELTLLTADETSVEKKALVTIGEVLRDLLRDSDSLFHIGVGVLCYSGGSTDFKEGALPRAFPWLLKATRQWLASVHAQSTTSAEKPRRLREIKLTNYRLPGERRIVLAPTQVHLVHGPNGSGKSSIVEALELVSAGTVERLSRAGANQYDSVIKNRDSSSPATIQLGWSVDGAPYVMDQTKYEVVATGLENALAPGIPASSFRLDQPLMDRLIGQFPHERASHFLQTFFSEASSSLVEYTRAADARKTLSPKLEQVKKTLESGRDALAGIQSFLGSSTTAAATHEEFPVLLNRWLEKTAVLDLVRRERAVRETVQSARDMGWQSDERAVAEAVDALDATRDARVLEIHERALIVATDHLQQSLATLTASTSVGSDAAAAAGRVTVPQAQVLNAVGRWIFSSQVFKDDGPFGDRLTRVIGSGQLGTYGNVSIGIPDWAEVPIRQVDALLNACKAVENGLEPPPWPGAGECPDYDEVANAQRALLEAGKTLSGQFIAKLRPEPGRTGDYDRSLIAAINELMALFTPARWGYSDIRLPSTLADGKLGVNIELGEHERPARAELHLNTAELNLFTVALFLLCATRVHKPLNVLVMDDPLQNMDELTSTALARGLAKVIRLWADVGRTEEVLLLFHGEGDLERFGVELPSARYRLPWLTPSPSSPTPIIDARDNVGDVLKVQSIQHLIASRAKRKAADGKSS